MKSNYQMLINLKKKNLFNLFVGFFFFILILFLSVELNKSANEMLKF